MEGSTNMANHTGLSDFERYCGGRFWNISLTWDTDQPDLTPCFERTVLTWVAPGWLWLVLPFYSIYLSKCTGPETPNSRIHSAKLLLCMALVSAGAAQVVASIISHSDNTRLPLALIVSPVITTCTLVLVCILIHIERKHGLITSGILFVFWVLTVISGIPILYSLILHKVRDDVIEDMAHFVIFFIMYTLSLVELVLFSFAEKGQINDKVCPEVTSSFLSRITYHWLNKLVFVGYKKGLNEEDVWSLNPRDLSSNNGPVLQRAWNKELLRCKRGRKPDISPRGSLLQRKRSEDEEDERTPLIRDAKGYGSGRDVTIKDGQQDAEPSLFRALSRVYGATLLGCHLCKLVCDVLTFIGPVLQRLLISFTEDKSQPAWRGFLYSGVFFCVPLLSSFFFQTLWHIGLTTGMRMKSAVIYLVYKKALLLSNEARKGTTVGEIVNLMSVDAQRLQDVTGYLWMVWSSPLQIAIAVWLLWDILGPSVLAGLTVMILLIPCNLLLAARQQKLQVQQMGCKDERIKLMDEVLAGIKVLKLYAWELAFGDKVSAIRDKELIRLQGYASLAAVGSFSWTMATFLVMLSTFTAYVLSGKKLEADTAFVALSLFNILYFPINLLPLMMSYMVTAIVSIKRLGKFLRLQEMDPECVTHEPRRDIPIEIKGATFTWGISNQDVALPSISLSIHEGSLVAIVGQVGSGKSSLISAMLGEMDKLQGTINLTGEVAYVAQQAWIQNATLRDNILFGKPYDKEKYEQVIEACALKPELEILPGGDQTEIGEKGINLSGGQKQRVSLARSVYSEADIYLLDDPLSAVDAHVGKHIFDMVIGDSGILKEKTRVLVTHGLHWLPRVSQVIVLEQGSVTEVGTYDQLLQQDGAFAHYLRTYLLNNGEGYKEESDSEEIATRQLLRERLDSMRSRSDGSGGEGGTDVTAEYNGALPTTTPRKRKKSISHSENPQYSRDASKDDAVSKGPREGFSKKPAGTQLVAAETAEVGRVEWGVFWTYARALGLCNTFTLLLSFFLYQASSVASNLWLTEWTNNTTPANSSDYKETRDFYLGIYGGLGGLQALFILMYAFVQAFSMVKASRILHQNMLYHVLSSPMSFYDTTPSGRILNRFSRDMDTVDNILPELIRNWMNTFFIVLSSVVVIAYSTPVFLAVILPLGIIYYFIQRFYIPTSRQLKRLESTTRSPVYSHFGETITGASTIRAYRVQQDFLEKSNNLVDHNLVFYFASMSSNRWLGFRLDFISSCIVLAASLFAVLDRDSLTGGIVGLSISYALQATSELNWMVRVTSDLESNIVSVERIKEYTETPNEAEVEIEATKPEVDWPKEGTLTFQEYSTRYRSDLDLVLNGISFSIEAGEKVGIVGRTGAGKSSLTLALFRIIEPSSGTILLDGVDVSKIGLHQLRSRITILPQDPVLFSGTLRFNIDPLGDNEDSTIWEAIRRANLVNFVRTLHDGLDHECGEGGTNLSVGQRQLVCLARALLNKTRLLVLDEATAAVDLETDELIQTTIWQEFAECTVLSIAHRINTVIDYDRILVLDKGKIAEYDSPGSLLKAESTLFYKMAKEAGVV